MWPSVKILFWSLFGLIDLESFEADQVAETAVGMIILALWLVLAVIVLLNMLIALISNAFQRVQVEIPKCICVVGLFIGRSFRTMLILSLSSLVPSSLTTSRSRHRYLFQLIFFI